MEKRLSYWSLEPHLKNLRFGGCYPLSADTRVIFKFMHIVYMASVLFLFLLYTVQQIIKIYQVRDDLDKIMDTMLLLLTNSDSIYKQIVIWVQADKIEELLDIMKGPIFNQPSQHPQKLLLQTARQARLFLRAFNYVALSTCLLWVLYPVIQYIQGKHVEFAIWLPFDANSSPQFYIAAIYVWVQTSALAYNNTTMDAFISFFLAQCKTQISILRLDLENVVLKSSQEALELSVPITTVFRRRFHKILLHYNEILKFVQNVQDIFGGALFYFFVVSSWILCTTAYRIVHMVPVSVQFVSMMMYMSCILFELFLYCYFGNEVNHESKRIVESSYAMDWIRIPTENRKDLIIFMERIKRPIVPKAGILVPLSSITFLSILRSSYSFYAFLKNSD